LKFTGGDSRRIHGSLGIVIGNSALKMESITGGIIKPNLGKIIRVA
jgi:hypothetical protein